MKSFLARRWFLLVLISGMVIVLVWPNSLLAWLVSFVDPRVVIPLALFLMAWTLPSRNLVREMGRPWAALWAIFLSYGALPAAAWLAGPLCPTADFHIGLLIAASVPCTLASAVLWTRRAGGSEATALLVIFGTNCTSWLFTTAWLSATTGTTVELVFWKMMLGLLLALVLPLTLGQAIRAAPPLAAFADHYKPALGVVSQSLVVCILFKAAAAVGEKLQQDSALNFGTLALVVALCLGLHTGGLFLGLWTGSWWGFERPSRIAVAFASSQKTLPVALLLFEQYYQGRYPLAVVPLMVYHFGQLVVDTFVADGMAPSSQVVEPEPAVD